MRPVFDEIKATQAAALLLTRLGGKLNYLKLIKMLYIADREAIRRWGMPITTDHYVSMKLGPVTSTIYDRIKASGNPNARPTTWSTHIKRGAEKNIVVLAKDPGASELSPVEEKLIAEVCDTDGRKDRFQLVGECHAKFPEWKNPGSSSAPIEIEDIVAALGLSEDEASHVGASIQSQRSAFELAI